MENDNDNILTPTTNSSDDNNSDENVISSCTELLPKSTRVKHSSGDSANHRHRRMSEKRHQIDEAGDPPALSPLLPYTEKVVEDSPVVVDSDSITPLRKYLAVAVLFLINLLNYMDRFTVAGVLLQIKEYFGVNNASAGLLQTIFIISYMIVAPLFGYLGDRYNRKFIILGGMLIWSGCTLIASFINDKSQFYLFLGLRGLVGIGEASYSTIAPTIIADLFVKTKRTRMLSVFFFAIPVGSGLGYIVGSAAAQAGGSWHWALRVTPALGVLTMVLLILLIPNPKRGGSETTAEAVEAKALDRSRASYLEDLKYVFKNRSFMSISIGFTFMAFVVGSLTIWAPIFISYGLVVTGDLAPCTSDDCESTGVSFIFGLITCIAGFLGVWIGAETSKKWKELGNKNADAHVCAIGLILSAPFLFAAFHSIQLNITCAWIFVFLGDLSLCLTWTLVSDMTLYVTMPNRRSTAQAVQILTMHLFGDAGSPYLLGVLADTFQSNLPDTYFSKFTALQWSMYTTLFACVLGGGGFLVASIYLQFDKKRVDDALRSAKSRSPPGSSDSSASGTFELAQFDEPVKKMYAEDAVQPLCYDENRADEEGLRVLLNHQPMPFKDSRNEFVPNNHVRSAKADFKLNLPTDIGNNAVEKADMASRYPDVPNGVEQQFPSTVVCNGNDNSVKRLFNWEGKESYI